MQLYKDGHLKSQAIKALLNQELDDILTLEVCEHIADCPTCALIMANLTSDFSTKTAPRGMTAQLTSRIIALERAKTKSFIQYCISVTAGVAAIITILFSGAITTAEMPVFESKQIVSELQKPEQKLLPEPKKQENTKPTPAKLAPPDKDKNNNKNSVIQTINQYFNNIFSPEE